MEQLTTSYPAILGAIERAERQRPHLERERREATFERLVAAAYERMDGREYGTRTGNVADYRDGRPIGGQLELVRTGGTINLSYESIERKTYRLILPASDAPGIAAKSHDDVPVEIMEDLTQLIPRLE